MENNILLEIKNLKVEFPTFKGVIKAVNIDDFIIKKGEFLGLVGESGCGKTVTSLAIARLIEEPQGNIPSGEIIFKGKDLLKKTDKEMRKIRGNNIAMVFQDPMSSLNPVFTVGDKLTRIIELHQKVSRSKAVERAVEAFKQVNLPDPKKILNKFPHELSGGMRQRVMIAMGISCNPELLIADEPTTALDVTIQAQILDLLNDLRKKINTSVLMITHDLGVIKQICERVAVMYAGNIVEVAPVEIIFNSPLHPYTKGLLKAIPRPENRGKELAVIKGTVPNLISPPKGCRFAPRCEDSFDLCVKEKPVMMDYGKGQKVACHKTNREESVKKVVS